MPNFPLICAALSALLGIMSPTAFAQETGNGTTNSAQEISAPEEFFGQSDPAPAWAVWRAFHRSLQFYASQSPDLPYSHLESEAGISRDSTTHIMNLGLDYLQSLDRFQKDRNHLGNRVTVLVPQGNLQTILRPPVERRGPTEADLALQARRTTLRLPRSAAGEIQNDVPENRADSVAAFNASAHSALEEHQQQLARQIGTEQYAALERWIVSEYGEQVRVPRQTLRISVN